MLDKRLVVTSRGNHSCTRSCVLTNEKKTDKERLLHVKLDHSGERKR